MTGATLATDASPGFIALEGGDSRLEVVPQHGGRVRSLRLGGREWLLPDGAGLEPRAGIAPVEGAGWDECAPAAGGGTMPEWVKGVGGRPIPLGGEARTIVPEVSVRTGAEGHTVECQWRGARLPWELHRTLLLRPDGALEARYAAINTGTHRLPFLWSAHLLLPLTAATRVRLPDAARLRVSTLSGAAMADDAGARAAKWPRLTLDGKLRDLSSPWSVPKRTLMHSWVDLSLGRSTIQVTQDDVQLSISTDGAGVPFCGVVIDRAGVRSGAPRSRFGRGARPALAIIPSLGAPDRFAEALGDWQSVTWLVPGEPRRWTLTFRVGH